METVTSYSREGQHVFHVYYTGLEPAEKLVALPEEMQRARLWPLCISSGGIFLIFFLNRTKAPAARAGCGETYAQAQKLRFIVTAGFDGWPQVRLRCLG